MPTTEPVFNVVIRGPQVSIDVLQAGAKGYEDARSQIIRRERDAIELHRTQTENGEPHDGEYSFLLLETAKAFALLQLKSIEQAVEDNLDRIQRFQG